MKTLSFPCIAFIMLLAYSCTNTQPFKANPTSALPASPSSGIAETFDEAKAQGVSPHIDSVYMSAVNVDSTKAVFGGHSHEFVQEYKRMLYSLAEYLQKNESFEHKNFRFYNRVYFAANGTIDYYLYNQVTGLTTQEEALFKKSLNEFVKTYKFPMTAKVPFAQCSPVTIQPN